MTAALEMSGKAASQRQSSEREVEESLGVLRDNARSFARLSPGAKAKLLRETIQTVSAFAEQWASTGNLARGAREDSGEEWFMGPVPTLRNLRLLAAQLESIERTGRPLLEDRQVRTRPDGRVEVDVFPSDGFDGALFAGIQVHELMQSGVDAKAVRERQASFYQKKDPEGGVSLILGAGNVSSIPPLDALYKSFAEGFVCIIKMNPVNEWVGPMLERSFAPFIERGFLRLAYGGAEVGTQLVNHEIVEDIHITGSNHTHDAIVWGPPGPERERRMKDKDPVLKKNITSELGNVSPVCIVPAEYSNKELDFIARNIAAMVIHNGSFNCNAAKMLVTARGWSQREALLERLSQAFSGNPTRPAYYPGAHQRYRTLTEGRQLEAFGQADSSKLAWTLIRDVDSSNKQDPLFNTEPFCSIISETVLEANGPAEFIQSSIGFLNDTLWGTLNAMYIIPPKLEKSAEVGGELDRAIVELRYGTVAINQWPAVAYGTVSPTWGGHPSATLDNIQSGLGWVHNTYLLEGVDKAVLRAPLVMFPKPVWFPDHRSGGQVGRKIAAFERDPSWLRVPGIALTALQG